MKIHGVLETCLYVDDLDRCQRFYEDVLGLSLLSSRPGRHLFFRCGDGMLLLFVAEVCSGSDSGVPPHGARGSGHVALSVDESELPKWRDHLIEQGVTIEQAVDWPQGGKSIYVRDPSANSVELATPRIWGLELPASVDY